MKKSFNKLSTHFQTLRDKEAKKRVVFTESLNRNSSGAKKANIVSCYQYFTITKIEVKPNQQNGVLSTTSLIVHLDQGLRVYQDTGLSADEDKGSNYQNQEIRANKNQVSTTNQSLRFVHQSQASEESLKGSKKQLEGSFKSPFRLISKDQQRHQCALLHQPEQQLRLSEQPRPRVSNQTSINRHPLLMIS
jgi:hypothetical protein